MDRKPRKTIALERLISIAAERFVSRRFEEVSISEIAMAAHCSNNTIYDVFGTKEGLYREAIRYNAQRLSFPPTDGNPDADPLQALVERVQAWLKLANDPVTREMFLTIAGHSQKLHALMATDESDPVEHWYALKNDARAAMQAGFVKAYHPNIIVMHLAGVTAYLALFLHALFGDRFVIPPDVMMRTAFLPLLTEKGVAEFDRLHPGGVSEWSETPAIAD